MGRRPVKRKHGGELPSWPFPQVAHLFAYREAVSALTVVRRLTAGPRPTDHGRPSVSPQASVMRVRVPPRSRLSILAPVSAGARSSTSSGRVGISKISPLRGSFTLSIWNPADITLD